MADNEFVSLSVTEDRLATDSDGSYKNQLIDQLNADTETLKSKKNSGLSPDQFASTEALIGAIEHAIKVIELTWFKHHMPEKQH
ncbi:EscE/YscE/SsaE family type III secretion system needle protein co-chaperone [Parendozoicomonas sp. Alg238-R29]|uniref:EscE/YscE/SsaE family type III secretion system needle protein co-chaperone n=1 Tax=Parendozoicomonas sp. Alg238-R29 TaxID=2993446 RepID=UPI00248E23AC|nr:EscE/YscE/SsaE family type III secretion system needle protein co-chaperone [Parendozoicomonas sp. Alg238-R29]